MSKNTKLHETKTKNNSAEELLNAVHTVNVQPDDTKPRIKTKLPPMEQLLNDALKNDKKKVTNILNNVLDTYDAKVKFILEHKLGLNGKEILTQTHIAELLGCSQTNVGTLKHQAYRRFLRNNDIRASIGLSLIKTRKRACWFPSKSSKNNTVIEETSVKTMQPKRYSKPPARKPLIVRDRLMKSIANRDVQVINMLMSILDTYGEESTRVMIHRFGIIDGIKKSQREIAALLGCSHVTVNNIEHKVYRRLVRNLDIRAYLKSFKNEEEVTHDE